MRDDLSQLLVRAASGDAEAFSLLYEEWFATVLGQARGAARGNEPEAADIVQEVFMKFIRRTPILPSNAALGAWFKRAVFTTARDRALAESRRRTRERARGAPIARSAADTEILAWLAAEIDSIDAETRDLLTQRFALGRTLSQIGEMFGLAPGAIDGRIARALRSLRNRSEAGHER